MALNGDEARIYCLDSDAYRVKIFKPLASFLHCRSTVCDILATTKQSHERKRVVRGFHMCEMEMCVCLKVT